MKKQYVKPLTGTYLGTPHTLLCNSNPNPNEFSIFNRNSGGADGEGGYDANQSLGKEENNIFSGW